MVENSSGQCDSGVEDFRRRTDGGSLAWPAMELRRHAIQLALRNSGDFYALTEEMRVQPGRVLAFPPL